MAMNKKNTVALSSSSPAPEAKSSKEKFGLYLAGDERNLPNRKEVERNTQEERKLLSALASYYKANYKLPLEKIAPEIFKQIQKGNYTNILKAPEGQDCYRVLYDVPYKVASKLLRLSEKELIGDKEKDSEKVWHVSGGGTLTPNKSKIQGWTLNITNTVMTNVSLLTGHPTNRVTIIFKSNTNNGNFFMNPININNNNKFRFYSLKEENEVISYGPVRFDQAVYMINNNTKAKQAYSSYYARMKNKQDSLIGSIKESYEEELLFSSSSSSLLEQASEEK